MKKKESIKRSKPTLRERRLELENKILKSKIVTAELESELKDILMLELENKLAKKKKHKYVLKIR
ncbi:MAG: hypothetical protein ACOCP4_07380 [Candidatus Woesearchaeota archaeon]